MNKNFFRLIIFLYIAGMLAYLVAIAYLGSFTRYMADDYCDTVFTQSSSPLQAVINRYEDGGWRAANRYSNLFFAGIVESLLGSRSVSIMPALMIVLWGIGLIVLSQQVRKLAGLEWHLILDILFGLLLAFFSVLEAPNRFQTFYWRSSMSTHFAPLVFLNFLVAFLLYTIRSNRPLRLLVWAALVLFFGAFLVGGFSEPPVAMMVVGVGMGFLCILFFVKGELRSSSLFLTGCVLAGAIVSLAVMAFSPAISSLSREVPSFTEWLQRTGQYTFLFLLDAFRVLPIPIAVSFVCSVMLTFVISHNQSFFMIVPANMRIDLKVAFALPFILMLLIAAGFSTSAYGQSYPVERARFFAHVLMTITLVSEGFFLGVFFSKMQWKIFDVINHEYLLFLILFILALYPFRAVVQILQSVPEYSARAQAWDRRDAHIYELIAHDQTNLTIPQFDGIYGIKELDNLPTHWVNRCAAAYYGVNSISAVTIHGTQALEDYYNDFGD